MATEFKNGSLSTQKVKINSYVREGEGTPLDKTIITYTRTDGQGDGKEMKATKFTSEFTKEEITLLKEVSSNKGELVLVKEFTEGKAKDGTPRGYWNLKTISPISTFVEKPQKPPYKPSSYKTNSNTTSYTKGGYNEAGVKSGAVLHDAVAVAIAVNGKATTATQIASIARELLQLSTQLEEEVRNGDYNSPSATIQLSKDLNKVEKPTVLNDPLEFDSLDTLDSIDIDL